MRFIYLLPILFTCNFVNAQVSNDSLSNYYLEDQIYVSLHYNLLKEKPKGVSQNGFSGGFSVGFIKDIPLNDDRNVGIGIGVGYLYNVYIQNLKISTINNISNAEIVSDFNSNKYNIHSIEVPLELRWRTSTYSKYKFWRVYGGVKIMYNYLSKSEFKNEDLTVKTKNIDEFARLNYGLFVATGYSTWNLYIYYGLSPLLKDVNISGKPIEMNDINIGLRFYIL